MSSNGSNEEVAQEFIKIVKNYFDNEIKRPEILGRKCGKENKVKTREGNIMRGKATRGNIKSAHRVISLCAPSVLLFGRHKNLYQ